MSHYVVTQLKPSHQNWPALHSILEARQADPYGTLGLHPLDPSRPNTEQQLLYTGFQTAAKELWVCLQSGWHACTRIHEDGLFQAVVPANEIGLGSPVRIKIKYHNNHERESWDTYSFTPWISDLDLYLFGEGRHWNIYQVLGGHPCEHQGVRGARFAVWAPNASRVSLVGHFNQWDGRRDPLRLRGNSGVWEVFIPDFGEHELYRFEIRSANGEVFTKSDPYARGFELRPANSSVLLPKSAFEWSDSSWMDRRKNHKLESTPTCVYEVHLGSWKRTDDGGFLNYRELAHQLAEYCRYMNFTHVELLPITEHPFDASWGYQVTGYYAPTSRFGSPDDFRYFVNHLHENNIGVLLDWVPAHFPKDEFALARFDGTSLYEHEDKRKGEHQDWGTLIYNYSRSEVRNFLIANALFWLKEFHLDGLRVDAVASMLYLDYSRSQGEWIPNDFGGRENIEAIQFLKDLNVECHGQHPGIMMIAEESTAWPGVTNPTWQGGLGFTKKWNMGWMHDTLSYFDNDPVHRKYCHNAITFALSYSFSEKFMLPLSHDEVVHEKKSLLEKMPGDEWQKFANLRAMYSYMLTFPGSKLLFMGGEFAQRSEWSEAKSIDWHLTENPAHRGVMHCLRDLNAMYRDLPALHGRNYSYEGFEWIDCDDCDLSAISFIRRKDHHYLVIAMNFTPIPRDDYRIKVPEAGTFRVIFNSDAAIYGGSNYSSQYRAESFKVHNKDSTALGENNSSENIVSLTLPPLAAVILQYQHA